MTQPQPTAPSWAPPHLARWFAALVFAIVIVVAAATGNVQVAVSYLDDLLNAVPTEPVPVPVELPPIVVPAVPVDTDDSPADSEPTTPAPQS